MMPPPREVVCGSSKVALITGGGSGIGAEIARQFAAESARGPHGIRVNAICPGHTETPLTAYLQDPEIRAGREAGWTTATELVIDGGIVASIYNHMPGRKWRD